MVLDQRMARRLGIPYNPDGGVIRRGKYEITVQNYTDVLIAGEIFTRDDYRLLKLPVPPKVVFDVGANIGVFTMFVRDSFPEAVVHAFEPHPKNAGRFRAHIGVDDHVVFHECAVYGSPELEPNTLVDAGNHGAFYSRRADNVTVPIKTIDIHTAVAGLDRIDMMKLDCEGAEFDILLSMTPSELSRVGFIAGEYHAKLAAYIGVAPTAQEALERLKTHLEPTHTIEWLLKYEDAVQGLFWCTPKN